MAAGRRQGAGFGAGAPDAGDGPAPQDRERLDKWLWAARFFKTRSLAADEIGKGRAQVNGQPAKPAREVRVGDQVAVRQGVVERTVEVLALSQVRGPASQAQLLYRETDDSLKRREAQAQARRLAAEPALAMEAGRPTKRDRRRLADWQRWSATLDPEG